MLRQGINAVDEKTRPELLHYLMTEHNKYKYVNKYTYETLRNKLKQTLDVTYTVLPSHTPCHRTASDSAARDHVADRRRLRHRRVLPCGP